MTIRVREMIIIFNSVDIDILPSFSVCEEVFGSALRLYFAPTFICSYSLMQLFYEFI